MKAYADIGRPLVIELEDDKPKDLRLDMICISCFDRFCREKGILDWGEHLRAVYYVAPTFTVQLKPTFLVLKSKGNEESHAAR